MCERQHQEVCFLCLCETFECVYDIEVVGPQLSIHDFEIPDSTGTSLSHDNLWQRQGRKLIRDFVWSF